MTSEELNWPPESIVFTLTKEYKSAAPFKKWDLIKGANNVFTKAKWGDLRIVVKIDESSDKYFRTYTCVPVSNLGIFRWFQIIYYKIRYHERNSTAH